VSRRDPDQHDHEAMREAELGRRRLSSAWLDALTGLPGAAAGQLIRGRAYARGGRVSEVHVDPGTISALVQGGAVRPYAVTVTVPVLDDAAWDRILAELADRAAHLAALFDGELPAGSGALRKLLPGRGELRTECTCPGPVDQPCKHAAAACYEAATVFDDDPFALLLVRGRSKPWILTTLRALRGSTLPDPPGLLATVAYRTAPSPLPGPALSQPRSGGTDPAAPLRAEASAEPPAASGISVTQLAELGEAAARLARELLEAPFRQSEPPAGPPLAV
jgi:uncharacterized Zn finger protein